MKKFLIGAVVVVALLFGGWKVAQATLMGGDEYYVKITTDGTRIEDKYDSGEKYIDYQYEMTTYDKDGQAKELTFKANKERPLRKNAYLALTYNTNKEAVTSWKEVAEADVPQKALSQLK